LCASDMFKVAKYLADMNTPQYELQVHVTRADVYRVQKVVNIVGLSLQELTVLKINTIILPMILFIKL